MLGAQQAYSVPPLPPFPPRNMAGPFDWCNWVVGRQVLCGGFPASRDDGETEHILTTLLGCGISTFVCLQAEFRPDAPESQWRRRNGLRPYHNEAVELLKEALRSGHHELPQRRLDFLHLQIIDGSTAPDHAIQELEARVLAKIRAGERVYIHCLGGHGRTGTLVALLLSSLYGLSAAEAMSYTQAMHDCRGSPQGARSPSTRIQRDQVTRIINRRQTLQEAAPALSRVFVRPKSPRQPGSGQKAAQRAGSAPADGQGRKRQAEGEAEPQAAAPPKRREPFTVRSALVAVDSPGAAAASAAAAAAPSSTDEALLRAPNDSKAAAQAAGSGALGANRAAGSGVGNTCDSLDRDLSLDAWLERAVPGSSGGSVSSGSRSAQQRSSGGIDSLLQQLSLCEAAQQRVPGALGSALASEQSGETQLPIAAPAAAAESGQPRQLEQPAAGESAGHAAAPLPDDGGGSVSSSGKSIEAGKGGTEVARAAAGKV